MDNVYIHPDGLSGNWTRGSGEEYELLRKTVRESLLNFTDTDGIKPISAVTIWEDVGAYLGLPEDRVGDLVITNTLGYGFDEKMSEDLAVINTPLLTGYKQAISPTECLWTPFMIKGPGIKRGYRIPEPIQAVDQYPTILKAIGYASESEGRVLEEIFV
jgi:hypothetical protein